MLKPIPNLVKHFHSLGLKKSEWEWLVMLPSSKAKRALKKAKIKTVEFDDVLYCRKTQSTKANKALDKKKINAHF